MIFQDSKTDKEKGTSTVIIKHRKKLYSGMAKLHPEDNWSELTGCRYAEKRAEIKALKDELKQKKQDCESCRNFVKSIMCYKNFNKEDPTAKAMFRQLNRRIKEVNKLIDNINILELNLKIQIRQQNDIKQHQIKND